MDGGQLLTVRAGTTGSTGFKVKNPVKVLVCKPRSYSLDANGQLFDALRALLLRRSWPNALQGLLEYLRGKHGSSLVTEVVRYKKRPKGHFGGGKGNEVWKPRNSKSCW